MTAPNSQNQVQNTNSENKPSDKEVNFRNLEAKLAQERQARLQMEQELQQLKSKSQTNDEEDDSEPYVDHKKLKKTLSSLGQTTQGEIQKAMEQAKFAAKAELKQEMWLEKNSDFNEVMSHAQKLYETDRELAEAILEMPEGFERQKLVYKNIKALGLHKPVQKEPSIQDRIDSNKKRPFYQPSGVGSAPYASQGDFSQSGQKNAYDKMKELQRNLRLG